MKPRDYKDSDLDKVVYLYINIFSNPPWNEVWEETWVKDRIRWLVSMPNSKSLVVEAEGNIVGAIFGKARPFRGKMEFDIEELFISTNLQRAGFGKTLVETLEEGLKNEGYSQTTLLTAKNSMSEKFYQALGFSRNEHLAFMQHKL